MLLASNVCLLVPQLNWTQWWWRVCVDVEGRSCWPGIDSNMPVSVMAGAKQQEIAIRSLCPATGIWQQTRVLNDERVDHHCASHPIPSHPTNKTLGHRHNRWLCSDRRIPLRFALAFVLFCLMILVIKTSFSTCLVDTKNSSHFVYDLFRSTKTKSYRKTRFRSENETLSKVPRSWLTKKKYFLDFD